MPVTLVDYDEAEARGRAALSPGETWAFTTATLAGCGFPVRVHSEAEIAGFCDFGNNFDLNYAVFARDHTLRVGSLHTAFTAQEARLIRRVSDAAAAVTKRLCGQEQRPFSGVFGQMGQFRAIMALKAANIVPSLRVLEIGPGCGYLGALLVAAGIPYASMDNTQSFYLWQSRLLEEVAGDGFCDWVVRRPSDPSRFIANHIPWWDFAALRTDCPVQADVIVSNGNLREMHSFALRYLLRQASQIFAGSPLSAFLCATMGFPQFAQYEDIVAAFAEAGFPQVCQSRIYAFAPDGAAALSALRRLDDELPHYDPDGEGAVLDVVQVMEPHRGQKAALSREAEFFSFCGYFTLPTEAITIAHEDRAFFTRIARPPDKRVARAFLRARRFAECAPLPNRVALYPGGDQTAALLDALRKRPDVTVVCVADRRAESVGGSPVEDVALVPLDALAALDVDVVLICHQREAEFAAAAAAAGVPADRLRLIHGDPVFRERMEETREAERIEILLAVWQTCSSVPPT